MPPPPSKRALLAAAAILLAPSPALAQLAWTAHAVGEASLGWTDNALSQPDTNPAGRVDATFVTLRPGVLALIDGIKTTQRLQYTFTQTIFLGASEANSRGHQVDYNLLYTLDSRSEIMGGASVSYGQLNIFNLMRSVSSPAGGAAGGAAGGTGGTNGTTGANGLQTGNLTFLTTGVYENLTHDYSNDLRLLQGLSVSSYHVLEATPPQPARFTINHRLGTERRYGRDALIAEQNTNYLVNLPVEYQGFQTYKFQSQLLLSALGRWRRDLSERFATELSTGAALAFDPSTQSALLGPTIGAAGRFHDDYGEAAVGYNRNFTPNVFLGQIYYGDELFARGSVPFFEQTTNMRISGGTGLVWSNLVDTNTARLTSSLRVFSADVGVTWDSHTGINASLRYQFFKQTSAIIENAASGVQPPLNLSRNAVMLTVGIMFPYRYAPAVPREPSGRVDRSDRPEISNDAVNPNRRVPGLPSMPGTTAPHTPNTGIPPTRGIGPSL